jgi:hypothetical protein
MRGGEVEGCISSREAEDGREGYELLDHRSLTMDLRF